MISGSASNPLPCFFCGRELSTAKTVLYVAEGPICSMCLGHCGREKEQAVKADAQDECPECIQNKEFGMNYCAFCGRKQRRR